MRSSSAALCCVTLCSLPLFASASEVWLPVRIGDVRWAHEGKAASLTNGAIEVSWPAEGHRSLVVHNLLANTPETVDLAPFRLVLKDGRTISADDMTIVDRPTRLTVSPVKAPRAGVGFKGESLVTNLEDARTGIHAKWTVELRSGANYLREVLEITPSFENVSVASVVMLDGQAAGAKVVGKVQGSPVATGAMFFGLEHPLSRSDVDGDHFTCGIDRKLPLVKGQTTTYSAVVGVAPVGQLRRAFLYYTERERAHPYRPFLHYNCWYDLGMDKLYDEAECIDRIDRFGQELEKKRGVKLSSYLFDDGWDDTSTTWNFDSGFPHGFRPLAKEAAKYGAGAGIWLSPWGGYGDRREQRLAAGKRNGYEIDSQGLALSGPKYYERFRSVCLDLLRQGVNQFKFDGTGSPDKQYPGSAFGSDFDAAIALIGDLRHAKPDLFVNMTTNTWPSPFWTRTADSIWRGGYDHSFAGVGTWRQKWITYRDGDTYERVVQRGPLYPINSLMLHGLIYAKFAEHLGDDPGNDFDSDVHAYFGTGTQLQEMYVTPTLLTDKNWDSLAEAANWARINADVLRDVHWIGGDPIKLEPYGHAAWNGGRGILVLRNPSDKPQTMTVDVAGAFELPSGKSFSFDASCPWKSSSPTFPSRFESGQAQTVALAPFEVLTLDLDPVK
ncbi:MAG TPA: enterotoxin [Fimbriimonas sp.]|nr:enterotoxin [Fimbriimonas sp.]